MTDRAQRTQPSAVHSPAMVVDPARIPPTPPGVPSYRDEIAAVASAIAVRFDPDRIVLFGSRAYGTPRPDSDIDLMVVMPTTISNAAQAERIRRAVDSDIAVRLQVLVRDPGDIARRLTEGDFFIEDAMLGGITLYPKDDMTTPAPQPFGNPQDSSATHYSPSVADWLRLANDDATSARFLLTAPIPQFNHVCFHAQQSAEKTIKALLEHRRIRFPRTHDLAALARLALPFVPALSAHIDELNALTTCSVDARYPGAAIDAAGADAALQTMETVRNLVSTALGMTKPTRS